MFGTTKPILKIPLPIVTHIICVIEYILISKMIRVHLNDKFYILKSEFEKSRHHNKYKWLLNGVWKKPLQCIYLF